MNASILCLIGIVLIAPIAPYGLRYLFAYFLREGLELFADRDVPQQYALQVGVRMATTNVIIFVIAWVGAVGCTCLQWSMWTSAAVMVLGVAAAVLATMQIARGWIGGEGKTIALIGTLCFAGGNLPIILALPALLAISTRAIG